jgi:hypothetical protein
MKSDMDLIKVVDHPPLCSPFCRYKSLLDSTLRFLLGIWSMLQCWRRTRKWARGFAGRVWNSSWPRHNLKNILCRRVEHRRRKRNLVIVKVVNNAHGCENSISNNKSVRGRTVILISIRIDSSLRGATSRTRSFVQIWSFSALLLTIFSRSIESRG